MQTVDLGDVVMGWQSDVWLKSPFETPERVT